MIKQYTHLEQSTLGETGTGKLIPQLPARAWASWEFGLIFWAAVLMHPQAVFLSAVLDAADASAEAPVQQAAGGFPAPLLR